MRTIPKIAHWIWLNGELPSWASSNIEKFRSLHTDWEIKIWNSFEAPEHYNKIINSLKWYSSKSDILRYLILHEYGGIYLDVDNYTIRNFNDLLNNEFFIAPCMPDGHTKPHLACGLIGSVTNSLASRLILEECLNIFTRIDEPKRITYGPNLLDRVFGSRDLSICKILPKHYFYSIPDRATSHEYWKANETDKEIIMAKFRRDFTDNIEPYSIHLWGVDGSSQREVQ